MRELLPTPGTGYAQYMARQAAGRAGLRCAASRHRIHPPARRPRTWSGPKAAYAKQDWTISGRARGSGRARAPPAPPPLPALRRAARGEQHGGAQTGAGAPGNRRARPGTRPPHANREWTRPQRVNLLLFGVIKLEHLWRWRRCSVRLQPRGHLPLPGVASNFGKRLPKPRGAARRESHGKAGAPRQPNPRAAETPPQRAGHRLPAEQGSLRDDTAIKQRQHRTVVLGFTNKTKPQQNNTTMEHVNIFLWWNHPKSVFNIQYTVMVLQKHGPWLPLHCVIHFCMKKVILCPYKRRDRRRGETPTSLAHYKNMNDTIQ